MASFAVMGISGIAWNVLIGFFFDLETLGVFNQVFAVYIFFSQFAVGGIHLSTLKHIAQYSEIRKVCNDIIAASLFVTLFLSLFFTLLFFCTKEIIGGLLKSQGVISGIYYATPGLFLFALNKVLLSVLNGFRQMRYFAVIQALRFILIIIALLGMVLLSVSGDKITCVFGIAECIVFVILIVCVRHHIAVPEGRVLLIWIPKHISFGIKSFMSGVLMELNTRIDVLMLGYFMSDKIVGIYSFAAVIAEGIFQFLVALRNNYNPIIVKHIANKQLLELNVLIKKGKRVTYMLMFLIGITSILIYPYVILLLSNNTGFNESWSVFAILVCGITISAGYVPFNQILLQAGKPTLHTIMIAGVLFSNVVLNYLLIPIWYANGAALATSLSFMVSTVLLVILTKMSISIII
jgi:O-antigen/teichoic acid export membrane protein